MGIPSEMRDYWAASRRNSNTWMVVPSPSEQTTTVREAVQSGTKTAVIAGVLAAVPTLIGCRVIPWAKANLNYTAQALIISAASIAGFFIAADKRILENAKENSLKNFEKTR